MATPPTFVAEYETVVNTTTSPKTVSVTTAVGDVLVLFGIGENRLITLGTPSGGTSLTWTAQQEVTATPTSDWCTARVWTATATTAETFTMSVTRTGDSGQNWGWICMRWSDSDGIGVSGKANAASAAPSVALTCAANSAICAVNGDWNALATSRTWRTINSSVGTEQMYVNVSGRYTAYANRWNDVGTAGSKTVGLTAPSTQNYSLVAVEVLGTSGGTVTGTLNATLPKVTGALTGAVKVTGAPAATIPKITAAIAGSVAVAGTLAASVPKVTSASTGAVDVAGALNATLPKVTAAITADVTSPDTVTGTLNATLPKVTASATAVVKVAGTVGATLPKITASAAGSVKVNGALAASLPKVTSASTGAVKVLGTLNAVLPRVLGGLYATVILPPPILVFIAPIERSYMVDDNPLADGYNLFRRVPYNTGTTVLYENGIYRQIFGEVTPEEVDAAEIAYLGGREYVIDEDEAERLANAGYGEYIQER